MKKGFILSFDSMNAIIILVAVLGLLSLSQIAQKNTTTFSQYALTQAQDGSLIGFYLSKNPQEVGLKNYIDIQQQPQFYECASNKKFILTTENTSQSNLGPENIYCGEAK